MKLRGGRRIGRGITSLRGRMVMAMAVSAALILPAVLLSLFYIRRMNDAVGRIVSEDIELMHVGDQISLDFAQARRDEKNFLLYRDSLYLNQNHEAIDRIAVLADHGRKLEPASAADFDAIVVLAARYRSLLDSLLRLPSQEGLRQVIIPSLSRLRQEHESLLSRAAATEDSTRRDSLFAEASRLAGGITVPTPGSRSLNDSLRRIQLDITVHSDSVTAWALRRVDQHRQRARQLAAWGQRNIVTVLLLVLVVLIWLLIILPRRAVFPIKRLMNALARAEEGDLDVRVKLSSADELGQLARQLNRSFARLRDFDERKVERILQLERRFRLLINDISEGVLVVDKTPNILLANSAVEELLGRTAAEAQGRKLRTCESLTFMFEPLERVLAGSTSHQECDILPGLPGSAVCIEALRSKAGEVMGALIVISNPRRPEPEVYSPTPDAGTSTPGTDA